MAHRQPSRSLAVSVALSFSVSLFLSWSTEARAVANYPKGFLWGAAFSAHQTEGSFEGGENGDWWTFEHPAAGTASPIAHGDTADIAVDHWHRYSEDLEAAQAMGLNTVRTSLAWEKIEPAPGVFSQSVLDHYRAELQRMHELGLKPMIALHHFTHPRWFNERGGWVSPDSPRLFLEYATRVVKELGGLCELWITFNEPLAFVVEGYLKGEIPPGIKSLEATYEAAFQMARAHRIVAAMIHGAQGPSAGAHAADGSLRGVGLVNSFQLYQPADPGDAQDVAMTDAVADLSNWAFIRGVTSGRMVFKVPAEVPGAQSFDRELPSQDLPPWDVGQSMDWIGVNYYTTYLIHHDPTNRLRAAWLNPPGALSDSGTVVLPDGLETILRQTAQRFTYPLIVGENGLADSSDDQRQGFIHQSLLALDRAVLGSEAGPPLDVRGYYHWSLMDNFEWGSGYQYKYGLVEIRFDDGLKRVPRRSATIYRTELRQRGGGGIGP